MENNNTMLTRFFTQNVLHDLLLDGTASSSLMKQIVRRYQITTNQSTVNKTVISEIYHYISTSYRNEYFYKNTLLNKLIINVHRLNTTTALTEVPIAKSKADFIMINGKAVVYEIKTELDTFERLATQVNDYYKAFDHVCVVTSEHQLSELQQMFGDSHVGIYVLTKNNTIRRIKEPEQFRESLSAQTIFKILNRPEYESIILSELGQLPDVTPVQYYRECQRLLCELPLDTFYTLFLRELKKRNKIETIDYSSIPESLHFLVYFSKDIQKGLLELQDFLCSYYDGG